MRLVSFFIVKLETKVTLYPKYSNILLKTSKTIIGLVLPICAWFRVTKIKEYGMLSGIKVEDLIAGASERVDENDKKESSTDFALWKKTDEGIQFDRSSFL